MMKMTTIAIADDHAVVRKNVRALIEDEPDLVVVGEAGSGLEAIHVVDKLSPDILVLDMILGDITGIEATCHIRKAATETSVIIYSMYSKKDYVVGARQAGANGYVLKKSPASELLRAIRVVAAGGQYFTI
jgi:DNA-binding NarL/FixJ family response regulator